MTDDPREDDRDKKPKADLRYTSSDDGHVRVERSLDGSGHLARGLHTNMHTLNFSARAMPRPREKLAPVDAPAPPVIPATPPPAPEPIVEEPASEPTPSVAQRLKDWMLRRPAR